MAETPNKGDTFFNMPLSIKRLNPRPTDASALWFSYAEALNYAQTDPTAYIGQIVSVYDSSTTTVSVYKIEANGTLGEIGSGKGIEVVNELPGTDNFDAGSMVYLNPSNGSSGKVYFLRNTLDSEGASTKGWVSIATSDELSSAGYGDMLKSVYDTDGDGIVDKAAVATSFSGQLEIVDSTNTSTIFKGNSSVKISAETLGAITSIPIADSTTTGGIKSSSNQDSVSVNADGTLSLNSISASKISGAVSEATTASKVKNSLSIKNADDETVATYDGSSAVSISAETLGAITSIPTASSETPGVVKVGETLSVDSETGVLNVNSTKLPIATSTTAGMVIPGSDFSVDGNGNLAISSSGKYTLPTASTTVKGGIKVDGATLQVVDEVASVVSITGDQVSSAVGEAKHASIADNYNDGTEEGASIKTALAAKLNTADLSTQVKSSLSNVEGGFAPLDSNRKISQENLPSYVDDIIEGTYVDATTFTVGGSPIILETGKIYIDITTSSEYRYTGTQLVSISNPLDYATEEDAASMTNDNKVMTPAKVKVSIASASIDVAKLFVAEGNTLILNCGDSNF